MTIRRLGFHLYNIITKERSFSMPPIEQREAKL